VKLVISFNLPKGMGTWQATGITVYKCADGRSNSSISERAVRLATMYLPRPVGVVTVYTKRSPSKLSEMGEKVCGRTA